MNKLLRHRTASWLSDSRCKCVEIWFESISCH